MTHELDSDPTSGTPSTPSEGSSGGTGDSGGSFDAKALRTAVEALTKRLEEVDARSKALQGDKDRGIKKTNEEVSELKRKIAEIEKLKKSAGLDDDAAIEELTFRDEVRALKDQLSKLNPVQSQPAGNGTGKTVDVAEVVKKYDLDGSDPEVIERIYRQDFNSQQEAEFAALKLAYQRAKPNPPNPAAASPLVGQTPAPANQQTLLSAFEKENAVIPRGSAYIYQRAELKAKYRDLARKQGFNLNI